MVWQLTTKDIYLRNDFDLKDEIKELGGMYDATKKRWFIPRGFNPLAFREMWSVLDCPYENRDEVKKRGARFDTSLRKWIITKAFAYDKFSEYWPIELKKFLFNERYAVERLMAESGQSDVFKAVDVENDQRVAVKLFKKSAKDETEREAVHRELSVLTETIPAHRAILSIIDWGQHVASGDYFIVTPYYPFDLNDYIGKNSKDIAEMLQEYEIGFDPDDETDQWFIESKVLETVKAGKWLGYKDDIFIPILEALCVAYESKILHRDVKPANIFLDYDVERGGYNIVLADFGLSKVRDTITGDKKTVVDMRSEPYGPDRTKHEKKFQETWDGYGWAAIVVDIVSEKSFESDEELIEFLYSGFSELVPAQIFKIILKCLSENPEERPENVKVLREVVLKNS